MKPENEIARGESGEEYENSGYIAFVNGDKAAIAQFGHCSCYGTWTSICGGGVNDSGDGVPRLDWEGTVAELQAMAERNADPIMPERECNPADYDHDRKLSMYAGVKKYFENKDRAFPEQELKP